MTIFSWVLIGLCGALTLTYIGLLIYKKVKEKNKNASDHK